MKCTPSAEYNRTLVVSDIGHGQADLPDTLTINVQYADGAGDVMRQAIVLDRYIIPAIVSALNAQKTYKPLRAKLARLFRRDIEFKSPVEALQWLVDNDKRKARWRRRFRRFRLVR